MTETEKYLFDLNGYLVVPDALTTEQVIALNTILDANMGEQVASDRNAHRFGGLLEWGLEYRAVIANPRILPYLYALIGENCRLDHDYLDIIRNGLGPIGATLHGGGTPFDPGQFYQFREGRMYNGLTVVAYALKDVNPGDGGFACVPGSHKANMRFPREWMDMSETIASCVTATPCKAGSAVIFTEALTHGTLPWKGVNERRTLFLKYCPHSFAWAVAKYDPTAYTDMPLEARKMLEGPNARYKGRLGEVK